MMEIYACEICPWVESCGTRHLKGTERLKRDTDATCVFWVKEEEPELETIPTSSTSVLLDNKEIAKQIREWAETLVEIDFLASPDVVTKVSLVRHAMRAFADRIEGEASDTERGVGQRLFCTCSQEETDPTHIVPIVNENCPMHGKSASPTLAELVTSEEARRNLCFICSAEKSCEHKAHCRKIMGPPASALLCAELYRLAMLARNKDKQ